jgi:hypothetical protein
MTKLKLHIEDSTRQKNGTTLALYHTHSLWEKFHVHYPINCACQTDLTMVTSVEALMRFEYHQFFQNFDRNSNVYPNSTIQRIYLGEISENALES